MSDINEIVISGNLTRDPELRYTPAGKAVTDISIAVNSGFGDKAKTIFLDVTAWGKYAEIACEHLSKGSGIIVAGELSQETWTDKTSGQKRSKIKVMARTIKFGERGRENKPSQKQQQNDDDFGNVNDSDVPF